MTGWVDEVGRALLRFPVRAASGAMPVELDAWVDTAFTGELVLPEEKISDLGLTQTAAVRAALGDGSEVVLNTYTCWITWFGEEREIQAVRGERQVALLGIGLLRGRRLVIDYSGDSVMLE